METPPQQGPSGPAPRREPPPTPWQRKPVTGELAPCESCGLGVADYRATCPFCGAPTGRPEVPAPDAAPAGAEPEKKGFSWRSLVVPIILVVCVAGVAGCLAIVKSSNEKSTAALSPEAAAFLGKAMPALDRVMAEAQAGDDTQAAHDWGRHRRDAGAHAGRPRRRHEVHRLRRRRARLPAAGRQRHGAAGAGGEGGDAGRPSPPRSRRSRSRRAWTFPRRHDGNTCLCNNICPARSRTPMEPSHREQKAQIVYLSHGGGPLPMLGDPGHAAMVEFMRRLGPQTAPTGRDPRGERPLGGARRHRAGRRDAGPAATTTTGSPRSRTIWTYPAPGEPALAARVVDLLTGAGIASGVDYERGFDHGLFVPLLLMFPAGGHPGAPALPASRPRRAGACRHRQGARRADAGERPRRRLRVLVPQHVRVRLAEPRTPPTPATTRSRTG